MPLKMFSESVKQKFNKSSIGKSNMRPTSNARNEAMLKECTAFAALLKEFEKDISANWHNKLLATFGHLRVMLLANLPNKYDEDEEGNLTGAKETEVTGKACNLEMLSTAAQEYIMHIQDKVLTPAKEWLLEHKAAQESIKELEALRLEVDARRRVVNTLQGKTEKLQTQLSKKGVSPEKSSDVQQTAEKLHHKDQKLEIAQHNYHEKELKLYGKLCTMVEEAAYLRKQIVDYVSTSKDCFSTALTALSPIATASASAETTVEAPVSEKSVVDTTEESPEASTSTAAAGSVASVVQA